MIFCKPKKRLFDRLFHPFENVVTSETYYNIRRNFNRGMWEATCGTDITAIYTKEEIQMSDPLVLQKDFDVNSYNIAPNDSEKKREITPTEIVIINNTLIEFIKHLHLLTGYEALRESTRLIEKICEFYPHPAYQ